MNNATTVLSNGNDSISFSNDKGSPVVSMFNSRLESATMNRLEARERIAALVAAGWRVHP